jgi:hypothetical protein
LTRRDARKELKPLYSASARAVVEVDVPPLRYLMIDGCGDPNSAPAYASAVEALFTAAYTAKFALKKAIEPVDYAVMPLEGLWWADDLSAFAANDRTQWQWTMMILQPSYVDDATVLQAMERARRKLGSPAAEALRLETLHEGRCAQVLHVGPFTEEGPTIERLHAYIDAHGTRRGKHHEIYLSDIRRAAPARWRTIVRLPMNARP